MEEAAERPSLRNGLSQRQTSLLDPPSLTTV